MISGEVPQKGTLVPSCRGFLGIVPISPQSYTDQCREAGRPITSILIHHWSRGTFEWEGVYKFPGFSGFPHSQAMWAPAT